jgi:superfamily I DNA/RNA helicase
MKDLFGLTGMNVMPLGERHSQSFTQRAAAKPCRIQTFHSSCAWILRTEARVLGLPADFVIDDEPKIKDLFASIRRLFNPAETGALRCMLLRPAAASVQSPCRNSAPRASHVASASPT